MWCLLSPLLFNSYLSIAIESNQLSTLTTIDRIAQDSNGFIWLTGQQGLTRYDGEELITFSNHNNEWKLPFTWTHDIELIQNKLLISTESKGVWWFDPNSGVSTQLNIALQDNSVYLSTYFQGEFYIFSDNIYLFNELSQHTTILVNKPKVRDFVKTTDSIYFFNSTSLNILTKEGYTPIVHQPIINVESIGETLIVVGNKKLTTYVDNTLVNEKRLDYHIKAITKAHNSDDFFILDEHGNIHKFTKNLVQIQHDFPQILSFGVNTIFHDESNVIWFYSGEGVDRISSQQIHNKAFYFNTQINSIKIEN